VGKIIWLASYPKSGNTWLRVFLANYQNNEDQPVDINDLFGGLIASQRPIFDQVIGINASELTEAEIDRYRSKVYEQLSAEARDPLFMKIHDSWRCNDLGNPIFSSSVTKMVLYLIRNPLDVAASMAHHSGIGYDEAIKAMGDSTYTLARLDGGLKSQLHQPLSSWSGHVKSWVDQSELPVHLIRYEDLLQAPLKYFGEIVNTLQLPWKEKRLRKAIEFSGFKRLQAQETKAGFKERLITATTGFFRQGKSGSWQEELTPEQVQQVCTDHRDIMQRFGYL